MAVDLRKVKKLIELVEESGIAELEVSSGDESVRIARYPTPGTMVTTPATAEVMPAPVSRSIPATGDAVNAPMAGTFYRAAHPQAAPYVEVGQQVNAGEVLCIIESMKMMHEIRAAKGGQVAEVCVDNSEPVNTGDVLFRLL